MKPKRRPRSSSGDTAPTSLIQPHARWINPAARSRARGDSSDGLNTATYGSRAYNIVSDEIPCGAEVPVVRPQTGGRWGDRAVRASSAPRRAVNATTSRGCGRRRPAFQRPSCRDRDELNALHDRLYVLEAAIEDGERDLTASTTKQDYVEALEWLLDACRPLIAARGSAIAG